ncbi:hypothetical protein ACOME3_002166 [Neoechinorhynchus agilis]
MAIAEKADEESDRHLTIFLDEFVTHQGNELHEIAKIITRVKNVLEGCGHYGLEKLCID